MSSHSVCKYSGYTLGYHVSDHPDVIIDRDVNNQANQAELAIFSRSLAYIG